MRMARVNISVPDELLQHSQKSDPGDLKAPSEHAVQIVAVIPV
jgi:hypothetical protein